jgi:hypothetical protein
MNVPVEAAIHLSIVATSRNDDHGGFLTRRTQHFVDGLIAQCKRHGLRAELILVEWNPPPGRASLVQELKWPDHTGPCDIRIITVSAEVHRTFQHADKIRLFQMLAKNAGIRRARGEFVLATNIDILFSDDAIRHLRDRLQPGFLYLADRVDVPAEVPTVDGFDGVLKFCEARAFRVNTGALAVERGRGSWRFRDRFKSALGARGSYVVDIVENYCSLGMWILINPRWAFRRFLGYGMAASATHTRDSRAGLPLLLAGGAWAIARRMAARMAGSVRQFGMPFTNACGDFTVMSREDWSRVRGYAEWNIFSWHLDTLLVYQANGFGIRTSRLPPKARVFHIDHSGGYAPEHAAGLFERLEKQGIPFLTDAKLGQLHSEISAKRRAGESLQFNEQGWGLAALPLPDAQPATT